MIQNRPKFDQKRSWRPYREPATGGAASRGPWLDFVVLGLGFMIWGSGFEVSGLGFEDLRVEGFTGARLRGFGPAGCQATRVWVRKA